MQQQFGSPAQPVTSLPPSHPPPSNSNPPSQPSSLGPSSLTQPLMPQQVTVKGSSNNDTVDEALKANTRMNMRRQKDIAAMAGIKCSQF